MDLPRRPRSESAEPYRIVEDVLVGPALPGATEVYVGRTRDEVFDRIAADMLAQALECVRQFGDFHVALSGGSTPEPLYRRLMYDPDFRQLPWRRAHLWIVDERCVSLDDDRSNWRMIFETIVQHADIPEDQVHPMAPLSPTADVDYERELRETLEWREKGQDRLDFVLLGMGADGHTASLFPHSDALAEDRRLVRINDGGQTPVPGRITMTYPLLNAARFVAVLACGRSKAAAIDRLREGNSEVETLPIRGIHPVGGELRWYLDAEAAGLEEQAAAG